MWPVSCYGAFNNDHSWSHSHGGVATDTCRHPCVQDALKWDQVHVIGHSMGAMIATQLASMYPQRLLSLTLISVTAGRWQSVPLNWAAIKYAWQVTPSILVVLSCVDVYLSPVSADCQISYSLSLSLVERVVYEWTCNACQL